ncbi:multidrug efflux RND transporter permease subunit [Aquabacterium sp.]|uniref:multidrug efflux RND transporter permease subunit n=1 Tax=Aquabacterium sp. TaxID=1872578 RepID=UPI003D6C794E
MKFSAAFIHRPVATTLLTLGVALSGILAFGLLPVSPLPQVDFPTISVQASLPGASPETMASSVAAPLERSLGRIAGVTEMTSTSSLGSTRVTLQFDLDRDIDGAAGDVQAALNAARSLLPTGLPSNPTYRKVNPADSPVILLSLTSDTATQGQMYDVAATILAQKLAQVEGIGQVNVGGSSLPAVRVELNPPVLNQMGVGVEDVRNAIVAANVNRPKGSVEQGDRHWQVGANDQAKKAADYLPLIVSYRNGSAVRLSDVAEVLDSVQDLNNAGLVNGKPSVLLLLFRQPEANIIETVDRVQAMMPQLRAMIPASMHLDVTQERTTTIRASLHEVERTLAMSVALVVMVVFLFLRHGRAALIPSVTVPVSLMGTCGLMYLCGFSLDNLSLMALTVATGFVVDDAVVVLENISRHVEAGMAPMKAAVVGSREVGFTVLSMSLSLIAVFIPILLMGGIVGRLFREFAVTLSAAILVSLVLSLTLTPMMCARLLKPAPKPEDDQPGRLRRTLDGTLARMTRGYEVSLGWAIRHSRITMLLLLGTVALNVYLYIAVPKGFFPQQDTGRIIGNIQADQSISFQAMRTKLTRFVDIVQQDPAVDTVTGSIGGGGFGGGRNTGQMFISLKPRDQRDVSADQIVARLRGKLAHEPGANLFLQPAQDLRIGGRGGNAQYQYTLQADEIQDLRTWGPKIRQALSRLPELQDVNTDQQDKGEQTTLVIDRDAASRLGLTQKLIDATLADLFSQRQVSTIYNPLNQYRVVMEAAPRFWQSPKALDDVIFAAPNGAKVPLSAFATYQPTNTPLAVNHQSGFASTTVSFNLSAGVSLSKATLAIDQAMAKLGLPSSLHGSFQGTAQAFQASVNNQPWLILAAIVAVYIVLGILYESLIHPITILSTLPSAGVGALLALMATGFDFSIIALIGVLLLIGIVKKNAIMMVDFALVQQRDHDRPPLEAITQACLLRFRPIMMTTLAALLGALPLALSAGDGAELRQPLGVAIVGGLVFSQILTLYTTPVVYLYLERLRLWGLRRRRGVQAREEWQAAPGHP